MTAPRPSPIRPPATAPTPAPMAELRWVSLMLAQPASNIAEAVTAATAARENRMEEGCMINSFQKG
jgi:hypothetical protein